MKINVCYIISSLSNEGPTNVLYNIIKYMDFNRFRVSLVTMVPEKENSRWEDFQRLDIRIVPLSSEKVLNPIAMFMRLRKVIKELNPDILHTHCARSMFLVPFLSSRYKKVETVHIYPGIQQEVKFGKWKEKLVNALSHFFTMRMDLPIACSESVAQSYWENWHFRMMAIPNGCSLPVWMGDEERRSHLRKQLGLKEDVRYFLFIGRFSQEKNPDRIVQAFEVMNDPCIGVILLGEGVMFEELKRHETDRILLPGFKPNVHDYVLASDYYISASDTEGLANTLLESMSVGLPCVLSDIPSHHEVVDKAEQPMAFLYDQHNLNAMTKAIRDILQLNKAQTGTYIRSLYARYYTAEKMSQSYQEAYIRLMASVNTKSKKEEK